MKFCDWINQEGLTYQAVARRLGLSNATTAHRYATGARIPAANQMRRIYLLTAGCVSPNDFYDLPKLSLDRPRLPPEREEIAA